MDREAWHAGVAKSQTWLSDWTELINTLVIIIFPCYLLAPVHVPSHFSCAWLFENLWIVACQAPLSMGFSRQEYWSRLPCPPPGNLPDPGTEPAPPVSLSLQVDSSPPEPPEKPISTICTCKNTSHIFPLLYFRGIIKGKLIGKVQNTHILLFLFLSQ